MKVIFEQDNRQVDVEPGTSILSAAKMAGIHLETDCGGMGRCGKCKVVVRKGVTQLNPRELEFLTPLEISNKMRLACQTFIRASANVALPLTPPGKEHILETGIDRTVVIKQPIRKNYIRIKDDLLKSERTLVQIISDLLHQQGIKKPHIGFSTLKTIPDILLKNQDGVTAVLEKNKVLCFEPGDTTRQVYGLAVDIGTTTVVGYLLDLLQGVLKGVSSELNAQSAYGSDVISRIEHAVTTKNGLTQLQNAIAGSINRIIKNLCRIGHIASNDIYCLVVVGNTPMTHLFWGMSPQFLSRYPYNPVTSRTLNVTARNLGIRMNSSGSVFSLPLISGFIGSDTVGVVLATGLHKSKVPKLAIDIGTNGEIVLTDGRSLVACSCAAGPAFEGAHIHCGMRGASGAIDRIDFNKDGIRYRVIDGAPPRGICGSGLVDAVAGMLNAGVITSDGRLLNKDELVKTVYAQRICRRKYNQFSLTGRRVGPKGKEVVITQKDIREIQLAKGAMWAGIQILIDKLGLTEQDIREVYLAGAFGNYIRPGNAVTIGLLPPFKKARVLQVGNAAGSGAKMALLSTDNFRQAEKISSRIEHVDLAKMPEFQQKFLNGMAFPL